MAFWVTSLPVIVGMLFGQGFLVDRYSSVRRADAVPCCFRQDALHYLMIIRNGYSYDEDKKSPVAFFPAYPLLSHWMAQGTGLPPEDAALVTALAALFGAFVLLARYVRLTWPEATAEQRGIVLAVFGFWPLGLFFRMPYSESLFVCAMLALLYGMARGWPLITLAVLAGLVSGIRPVGVALTITFFWHMVSQPTSAPSAKVGRSVVMMPLACWGLLFYMAYLWFAFGDPLAFARTQEHWSMLAPQDRGWPAKLRSLATLEPIWGVYVPGYERYWGNLSLPGGPPFSLSFWNPILFLLAAGLLLAGGLKRWLSGSALVCGTCLLAIPYVTRGYEMSMASHGRFAAVVVVNYVVIARTLARASPLVVVGVCAALAVSLCLFTALYAADLMVF